MASEFDPIDEEVFCIPTSFLRGVHEWQGFCNDLRVKHKLFNVPSIESNYLSKPRSEVENDPSFKQLITYSIVQYGIKKDSRKLFSYTRGTKGGEPKLHAKKSIGIGGHISGGLIKLIDAGHWNFSENKYLSAFREEAKREIDEEVSHTSVYPSFEFVGLINDDSNPVGAVHLGLVFLMVLNNPSIETVDPALCMGSLVPIKDIVDDRDSYENWSQIVIDSLGSISRAY